MIYRTLGRSGLEVGAIALGCEGFAGKTSGERSLSPLELTEVISELEREMLEAAEALEFERAAELRDRIRAIEKGELKI